MMWLCTVCKHVAIGKEAPDRCPVCGAAKEKFVATDTRSVAARIGGTKTEANLKAAFAGESQANRKYLAFAAIADLEGNRGAGDAFRRAAADETAHAHAHLARLAGLGSTAENLKAAIAGESHENDVMYPEFARAAREEGLPDVAAYFEAVARHESRHAKAYGEILDKMETSAGQAGKGGGEGLEHVNVLEKREFANDAVKKVAILKTEQLGADTYYFQPGQVLAYHKHPGSDQVFFILSGQGRFYLDDGSEKTIDVRGGSVVLAPADVWHQLVNTGNDDLIAVQVTKLPASGVQRQ